jgi:hypothetical protein
MDNTYLGNFSKSSALLSEIDDDTAAAILGLLYSLLNTEDKVWSAGTDVGAKDITTIALVVDTKRKPDLLVGHLCRVTEAIYRQATWVGLE